MDIKKPQAPTGGSRHNAFHFTGNISEYISLLYFIPSKKKSIMSWTLVPGVLTHRGTMRISPPNHTQAPNELFDEWLPLLGHAELKVLMVIIRKTFGWHKIRDRISLTQLETITGLERRHVCKAIKSLENRKLITKIVTGKNGEQQTFYELFIEDSNNFDQCPKDTRTSVFRTPTKETLTKEKKENSLTRVKEKSASPPPLAKSLYEGKFEDKILITQEQHTNLCMKYGSAKTEAYVEKLYNWSLTDPDKFKKKKRHDIVVKTWIERDLEKEKSKDFDKDLNDLQKENWKKNQALVADLKAKLPAKAGGLNWYYKSRILKNKFDSSFDVLGIISHKDFCITLGKHLGIRIVNKEEENGPLRV